MATKTSDTLPIDLHTRVKLAANIATPGEILAFLVRDSDVPVRAALALNPSLPPAANMKLAQDGDERVRLLLARKIAGALPGLSEVEGEEVRERTLQVLSALIQDEAVRIRAAIAVVAAELPNIPRDVALQLAADAEISVSEPMLRLSPLLSATDLLELLATPAHCETIHAIACRSNLPESVSDAIVATVDSSAIRSLLMNQSAAIRESTLDALVARAGDEPTWHAPLVARPRLPDHAARALSEIVTGQLLKELATRTDLGAEALTAIQDRLSFQLMKAVPAQPQPADQALLETARQLDASGNLTEELLMSCLRSGELRKASACLAVAAGVAAETVERAASLRNAKALVSLVWKAGFGVRVAGPVQSLLGQIAPRALLHAKGSQFPLSDAEMNWQLDFLGCHTR